MIEAAVGWITVDEVDDRRVIDTHGREWHLAIAPLVNAYRSEPQNVDVPRQGLLDITTSQYEVIKS